MDIEDLMERYMDEDLTSFNNSELKKIRLELKRNLKDSNEMLSLPLTELESSFWCGESSSYNTQISDIEKLLENK